MKMKIKVKRMLAAAMAAVVMAVSVGSVTADAAITNNPNEFILIYTNGAPSSDVQTSLTNYAAMGSSDLAITITVTSCAKSSNTKSCRFTAPLRADSEPYWTSFSYDGQQKDIALKSHGINVYFTCELVKTNASQGYGNCHFNGTAD